MPRLLQINITANWGSTGKIAEAIGSAVMTHNWDSYVAYGRIANHTNSNLIKIGDMASTYIHYAFNRIFDMEGRSSVRATKALVKDMTIIKPDIVQLHNIHDHYLNYRILFEYLNQTDIKVVWTFHDCWAFTGHCYHFVQQNCMKWQSECGQCPQRNRFMDRSRENFLLKKSLFTANKYLTIVPCSDWMGDFVGKSFFRNNKIKVIHNGIDLDTFNVYQEVKKHDSKFRIIAVSNIWLPYKGIFDIFKLREMLSDEFEITMVGLSPKQLRILPSGINGITRTQNVQHLVELYNESDVLINPTYSDTFPTVNLEALACGTPVITYRTGGSPEAIDNKTGVVIEQGDVYALSNAIKYLREHPLSLYDCRKRAEDYFDQNKCYEQYYNLYESLLD